MSSSTVKYPGFGLPVNEEGPPDRFPNAVKDWAGMPITVRERTMMVIMNSITDKPDWDRKVFDDNVTQKWRQEALDAPDMDVTVKMLDYTIAELQDKAKSYQCEGLTSVFDLDVAVVKSDSAISSELAGDLKVACLPLESVAPKMKDWHPGSDGKVLDLVHPSLFPLIYGRSKVLASGRVALEDSVEYAGKGEIIEVPNESQVKPGSSYAGGPYWVGRKAPFFWSKNFQWLPCQVNFTDNEEIKITSYINNLHPVKYQDLYTVIAKCIAKSVPLWNRTLSATKSSRKPRIDMGMTQYDFPQGQETPDDYRLDGVHNDYERRNTWETTTRVLIQPEPDDYALYEASGDNKIDLRTQFRSTGLQVIVKLANIELSPEKPDYDGGSWHIEGQLNERICASALYYYDSENITESFLAFRHRVDDDIETKAYEQDDYEGVETIYGIEQDGPKLQELGKISTRQGRLIAFPNVLQHRVLPFSLQDPSKRGHRKILALFLVDPHIPILSTANVPPQQKEWWSEKIREDRSLSKLPPELAEQIIDEVSGIPMSLEEAKEIRLGLMEERKAFVDEVEADYQSYTFSFCEH